MAKRGVRLRGRWILAAVLGGFVATAAAIITRRSYGVGQAQSMRAMYEQQALLRSERVRLEAAIKEASSRSRIVPIAERHLGMRVPADTQVVILRRPAGSRRAP